jgi:signal transduction histidine kinase
MFTTIIRNLVDNAIKFTKPTGKIDIYSTQKRDEIEIVVSDNGIGISEETRNKLFSIDTNLTTTGPADEKGSGLGLVLCKEFVEKHGGNIWVESSVGKGCDFRFTIPLKQQIISD